MINYVQILYVPKSDAILRFSFSIAAQLYDYALPSLHGYVSLIFCKIRFLVMFCFIYDKNAITLSSGEFMTIF